MGEWRQCARDRARQKRLTATRGIRFLCSLLTTLTVIIGSILALSQANNGAISNEHDQYTKLSEKWLV